MYKFTSEWSYLCLDYVQESKKSKLLLGKNNSKEDEEEGKKTPEQQKDKFNLSHDEYYTAKNSEYTYLSSSNILC